MQDRRKLQSFDRQTFDDSSQLMPANKQPATISQRYPFSQQAVVTGSTNRSFKKHQACHSLSELCRYLKAQGLADEVIQLVGDYHHQKQLHGHLKRISKISQSGAPLIQEAVNTSSQGKLINSKRTLFYHIKSRAHRTIVSELIELGAHHHIMDRIVVQNNILKSLTDIPNYETEYFVPEDELNDIRRKHNSNIFQYMAPGRQPEEIFDMEHYQLIRTCGPARIYSMQSGHRYMKMVMAVQHSQEKVLTALVDPNSCCLWNDQVKLGAVKLKICSENSAIVYQRHKASGGCKERDFLFVRHLFRKNGVTFMADRSITHPHYPPIKNVDREEIQLGLWAFQDQGHCSTKITYMLQMSCGRTPEATVKYMEEMGKLSDYLRNNRSTTTVSDYFDPNWDIAFRAQSKTQTTNKRFSSRLFDFDEDHYLTAFPEIQWFCCETGNSIQKSQGERQEKQGFSFLRDLGSPFERSKVCQHERTKQTVDLQNYTVETQVAQDIQFKGERNHKVQQQNSPKYGGAITRSSYSKAILGDTGNLNCTVGAEISLCQFDPRVIANLVNRQNVPGSICSLVASQDVYLANKRAKDSVSVRPPNVSQLAQTVKKQHPSATPNKSPCPKQQAVGLSFQPDDVYISKESSVRIDKKTGMVILPRQYLNTRHRIMPIKAAFRVVSKPCWKDYFLKNMWEVLPSGELLCYNKDIMKEQHGIMSYILTKLAKNIVTGKNMFDVSLPISIFNELSFLEMFARGFGFAPLFLERAASQADPVQRIKLVVAFSVAYFNYFLDMENPFNPILGQTFQGWVNGCPVYCEQISHHPPISSIYMVGRGYRVFATIEPKIELGMNAVTGLNEGEFTVQFDSFDKSPVHFQTMNGHISGLAYGDRKFSFVGKSHFYDDDGHFLELKFNPHKKGMFSIGKQTSPKDCVEGTIVKTSPAFVAKFRKDKKRAGPNKKEMGPAIATVAGRWTESIQVDGKQYYNRQKDQPCEIDQEPYPLHSNCRYREDIVYLRMNDKARAQQEKDRLENLQRADKKLRQKSRKKAT